MRPWARWPGASPTSSPTLPGPRWPAGDLALGPLPARRPRPPIWVGGSTPQAIRRAAALGDGWLAGAVHRGDLPGHVARLHELRAELRGGAPVDVSVVAPPLYLREAGPGPALPGGVLAGGAGELAESLRELVAMGANHVQLRFAARDLEEYCAQVARFGVEVAPLLGR